MKIYICSIEELADAASFDAASLKINALRREKLEKIKNQADRERSLCAGLLLNYAIRQFDQGRESRQQLSKMQQTKQQSSKQQPVEELSIAKLLTIPGQQYDYRQDAGGKPFLADIPGFFFNLSHSGEYVLCAWDEREIGADLQKMERPVADALAKKVMTQAEYANFCKLSESERTREFYRVWTIKESCCKLTGKGLSQNFQELEVMDTKQQISRKGEQQEIHFQTIPWRENYWIAVSRYESL